MRTTQSHSSPLYESLTQLLQFPMYKPITKTLNDQHLHWQIDIIKILLNRNETIAYTHKVVKSQKPSIRVACNRRKHSQWNCPHVKKQAQLRRYELSKNK